jgi:hypothetical protein
MAVVPEPGQAKASHSDRPDAFASHHSCTRILSGGARRERGFFYVNFVYLGQGERTNGLPNLNKWYVHNQEYKVSDMNMDLLFNDSVVTIATVEGTSSKNPQACDASESRPHVFEVGSMFLVAITRHAPDLSLRRW